MSAATAVSLRGLMGSDVSRDPVDYPGETEFTTPITSGSTTTPIIKPEVITEGIFTATIVQGEFIITASECIRGLGIKNTLPAMRLFQYAPETMSLTPLVSTYKLTSNKFTDLAEMKVSFDGFLNPEGVRHVATQFLKVLARHWEVRKTIVEHNIEFIKALPWLVLVRVYRHLETGDSISVRKVFAPVATDYVYSLEEKLDASKSYDGVTIDYKEVGYPDDISDDGHHPPTIYAQLDTLLHDPKSIKTSNDCAWVTGSHEGLFEGVPALDEVRVATDDDIVLDELNHKRGMLCRSLKDAEAQRDMAKKCVAGKYKLVSGFEEQIKALDKERNAIMKRITGPKKTKKH